MIEKYHLEQVTRYADLSNIIINFISSLVPSSTSLFSRPKSMLVTAPLTLRRLFAALNRPDSSASRRKVSSISASETSEQDASPTTEEPQNSFPQAPEPKPEPSEKDLFETHLFDLPTEEDRLEYNMPWLPVMTKLLNSFNYHCTHQTFCHPQCYRRQMRASRRIMEAARHVSFRVLQKVFNIICLISVSIPRSMARKLNMPRTSSPLTRKEEVLLDSQAKRERVTGIAAALHPKGIARMTL